MCYLCGWSEPQRSRLCSQCVTVSFTRSGRCDLLYRVFVANLVAENFEILSSCTLELCLSNRFCAVLDKLPTFQLGVVQALNALGAVKNCLLSLRGNFFHYIEEYLKWYIIFRLAFRVDANFVSSLHWQELIISLTLTLTGFSLHHLCISSQSIPHVGFWSWASTTSKRVMGNCYASLENLQIHQSDRFALFFLW